MLKRLITYGFIALSLGVTTNVCFNVYFNRDFIFFSKLVDASTNWEEKLRKTHPRVYVIAGGSSTRTGVDPQLILDEFNIPIVTASLGAGYGMDGNLELALTHLRAHDTLIIAMEPLLIAKSAKSMLPAMGAKMLLKMRGLDLYRSPFLDINSSNFLYPFSGNSPAIASHIAKTLTEEEGKRYSYDEHSIIHQSGWMEVTRSKRRHHRATIPDHAKDLDVYSLNNDARLSFQRVLEYAKANQIGVIALVPRFYADESARANTLWLSLSLTRMGIPVLYDKKMGVETDVTLMADTVNHLKAEGMRDNSREIGANLRDQRFWTEKELISELEKRGWDSDGKRIQPPSE